jgi:hypothetical protein
VQPEFSAASLPELIDTLVWGLLAFCLLSYFIGSYLFEVLAQKLGEPRWMAWVPIANLYLALRLLGWGNLFWMLLAGYGVGLLGILLPAPLSMIAALAIIPTALAGVVVGFVYWPMLARRRDLPIWVGLLLVLPQFALMPLEFLVSETALFALSMAMSAVAFAAFLWIVFHDGAPEAPPHPIGFVLTGFGALVGVVLALKLPVWLEESGAIEQMQVALAQASQASLDGTSTEESEDFAALLAMFGDEAAAAANPDAKPEEAEPARTSGASGGARSRRSRGGCAMVRRVAGCTRAPSRKRARIDTASATGPGRVTGALAVVTPRQSSATAHSTAGCTAGTRPAASSNRPGSRTGSPRRSRPRECERRARRGDRSAEPPRSLHLE